MTNPEIDTGKPASAAARPRPSPGAPAVGASSRWRASPWAVSSSASAPPVAAPPRPATAARVARARVARARPATPSSSPASSGARRPTSTRSAPPPWPTAARQSQLIYESLIRFNLLDGSLDPGLGKELKQTDDQTLKVPLQDGTKWSDGSDLTADDVVFTFELAKKDSSSYSNVWNYLDSVTAADRGPWSSRSRRSRTTRLGQGRIADV